MKYYYEMTKTEKLGYNSRVVAHWIKNETGDIMLPCIKFKRKSRDGWHNEFRWCVWDCNNEWSPIDPFVVCTELGIENCDAYRFARTLRDSGYDAREINGGIIIIAPDKKNIDA